VLGLIEMTDEPLLATEENFTFLYPEMIDNTILHYIPIHLPCGVQALCSPQVLSKCPMILRSLQTDLLQILKKLPYSLHALIRRTKIWINASYSYGLRDNPRVVRHSTAHHEEAWLIHCARDIPDKSRGIEIYSSSDFLRMRLHWNGCGLLLHELCHIIHQFALNDGINNDSVKEVFEGAKKSGLYDQTLRRDWAGFDDDCDMAYCLVDHKEFFSELSVTYLSDGYHELDEKDKTVMEDCCPPLLQPYVADRVLESHGISEPLEEMKGCWSWGLSSRRKPKLRLVDPIFQETALARSCLDVVHCNKNYPFTRGQLRYHDPVAYSAMREIWRKIAQWDDLGDEDRFCGASKGINKCCWRACG
jgi:hypothetical protein